jgi:anti-anti-sigma factor
VDSGSTLPFPRGREGQAVIFEVTTLPSGALGLFGELDMGTVAAFDDALKPLCAGGGTITLQVSNLTFMDSTGLHALVRAAQELQDRGCIIIHGLNGNRGIRTVLELGRIGDLRNIHLIECEVI